MGMGLGMLPRGIHRDIRDEWFAGEVGAVAKLFHIFCRSLRVVRLK